MTLRMKLEEQLKIDSYKHSSARTNVKQAADTSPAFKTMKKFVKEMNSPNASSSRIYHLIDKGLTELKNSMTSQVVQLAPHRHKAILITTSKLPSATRGLYSTANVKKRFMLNGQIDNDSELVPSFTNMSDTYCGDVSMPCLKNKEWLI